ncbi:hypothetical protein CQJ94_17935 [Glycomyces fuscus]|nr:hypothetical protein CQJ94_17935 [Glycomyces fuscus]
MAGRNRGEASALTRRLVVGACVLGILLLLGAVLGPLWWGIAPRAEGTALGGGEVFTGTTEDVFAAEGCFALITAFTGLVAGYTAYMVQFPLSRRRFQDLRMVCLVAGFLGSLGGAVLTWRIGVALDGPAHAAVAAAEPGATVQTGLQLDATAFLLIWPLVFVLQYGLLDAISLMRRDLPGVPEHVPVPRAPDPAAHTASGTPAGRGPDTDPAEPPSAGEPVPAEHDQAGPEEPRG